MGKDEAVRYVNLQNRIALGCVLLAEFLFGPLGLLAHWWPGFVVAGGLLAYAVMRCLKAWGASVAFIPAKEEE